MNFADPQPPILGGLKFLKELPRPKGRFLEDALGGLSRTPKVLAPKYFYDDEGAKLFEAITETPEYYVTRAETALLERHSAEIAAMAGQNASMIEPGSGAGQKARILLRAFDRSTEYILFDISRTQLEKVGAEMSSLFPDMSIGAVAGDFTQPMPQPSEVFHGQGKRICFFPGGTLGNFEPEGQRALLENFRTLLRPGDALLLGVDRIKDAAILDAAYNDASGLTAAFNLNVLHRMQRDLGAEVDVESFRHRAFFVPSRARIEMHLLAIADTRIVLEGEVFPVVKGESIHTENSYKFDEPRLEALAGDTGFQIEKVWGSQADAFMLAWLSA